MSATRKRPHEKVLRTTITIHPKVWDLAQRKLNDLGYPDFSTYISELIRVNNNASVRADANPPEIAA